MFFNLILYFLVVLSNYGFAFRIDIKCSEYIVTGATQRCIAKIYENDKLADGTYRYYWKDDAIPKHERTQNIGTNIDTFNVTYNDDLYSPGYYIIRVEVCHLKVFGMFCTDITSNGESFMITETLNGNVSLTQQNITRNKFVSTANEVQSSVNLVQPDREVVVTAPTVITYWFVDCIYYGITNDYMFKHNFTKPGENHVIEALVMADFTPIPTTTTTTTTTTTVAPPTSTTASTNSSTLKPGNVTESSVAVAVTSTTTLKPSTSLPIKKKNKRSTPENAQITELSPPVQNITGGSIKVWKNGVLVKYNGTFPYVCNSSAVVTNKRNVYGYFSTNFMAQAPVSNITIAGNNWLQQWEVLDLNVKCQGSLPIQACLMYLPGEYNVTGNETCNTYQTLDRCEFPIRRFLQGEAKYTILIFFKNEVSAKITPVTVTIYKVKQQAQLSVIVVPVAFSLVAVVTIVFGVAYYLQNRSRFIIEVADFDFGQQYTALEYKTFKDRLKDSIMNTFTRDPVAQASTSSETPIWPQQHQKYTTMN